MVEGARSAFRHLSQYQACLCQLCSRSLSQRASTDGPILFAQIIQYCLDQSASSSQALERVFEFLTMESRGGNKFAFEDRSAC